MNFLLFVLFSVACVYFFFFQAEDGIRDFHVTGVQTCALPISCPPHACLRPSTPMPLLPPRWIGVSSRRSGPVHGGRDQMCRCFGNCREFGTPTLIDAPIFQWLMNGIILARLFLSPGVDATDADRRWCRHSAR